MAKYGNGQLCYSLKEIIYSCHCRIYTVTLFIGVFCFFANGQGTGTCPDAAGITNCTSCWNPEVECLTCSAGYWWKDRNTCLPCPDFCQTCSDTNLDGGTECTECLPKFYETEENKCAYCTGHCVECSDAWSCDECESGYRAENDEAIGCVACTSGCLRCLDALDTSCIECAPGFYLEPEEGQLTGRCRACGLGCIECTSTNTCTQCVIGTTWSGTECISCIEHCDSAYCTAMSGCIRCVEGYFLNDERTECRSCDHCDDCPLQGECLKCEVGYINNVDGTCHACPDINDVSICTSCGTASRGRVRSSDGQCLYCPQNCATCSDAVTCITCVDGYYEAEGACVLCDTSCVTCSGRGRSQCTSCSIGQGLYSGHCLSCPIATQSPKCATCTGEECNTCDKDFFLTVTATDTHEFECRVCSSAEPNESEAVCEQCAERTRGRYMSNTRCVGCDAYGSACITCSTSRCNQCEDTWFINSAGNCERCADSTNCLECAGNGASDCMTCRAGYYRTGTGSTGECSVCIDNCDACVDDYTCVECTSGFYHAADTICQACDVTNCIDCLADVTQCAQCDAGFWMADPYQCLECEVANCLMCPGDVSECAACNAGLLLADNECEVECLERCTDCSSATPDLVSAGVRLVDITCDQCGTGSIRAAGNLCLPCGNPNCVDCNTNYAQCVACADGFYRDGNTCTVCDGSCATCDGAGPNACITCSSGAHYYHSGNRACYDCTMADAQCTECSGQTNTDCTQCASTHFLMGTACMACQGDCVRCETSATHCLECSGGRYAHSGSCYTCSMVHSDCTECTTETAGPGACTACTAGNYVNGGGTCTPCDDGNCDECSGAGTNMCTTCEDGYFETGGACTMCDGSCATCNGAGPNACLTCMNGAHYYHSDTMTCYDCTSVHAQCEACSGETANMDCITCASTHYQHGGSCLDCSGTYSMCTECTMEDAGTPSCTACVDGWYAAEGMCVQCTLANCEECNPDGCMTCSTGFYAHEVAECTACPGNCDVCNEALECTDCAEGHFVTGTTCTQCSSDCTECTATNMCTDCDPGFFVDNNACTACATNCMECSSASVCTQCNSGYTVVDNVCVGCPEQCSNCDDGTNTCRQCVERYSSSLPVCDGCGDEGCTRCSDREVCTECAPETQLDLDTNNCVACSPDCMWCEDMECLECNTGYRLVNNICVQITSSTLPHCAVDNGSVCTQCDAEYFLDPGTHTCIACAGVSADLTEYVCTQCVGATGHNVVQHWQATCNECPEYCLECGSSSTCTRCVDGMYTDGTRCIELRCDDYESFSHRSACTACSDYNYKKNDQYRGLVWTGSACRECPRNCEVCTSEGACGNTGDSCREHHVWDATDQLCVDCDFNLSDECTGCVAGNTGRYLASEERCMACLDDCTACEETPSECTECSTTHFHKENSCIPCTDASITQDGCVECQSKYAAWSDNVHGWFTNEAGVLGCHACPALCAACSQLNDCDTCFGSRYFDRETQECKECFSSCAACSAATTCSACAEGYYYLKDASPPSCSACPDNCHQCTHDEGCRQCVTNYYRTAEELCAQCSTAISLCQQCHLEGTTVQCDECPAGLYPAESGGIPAAQCAECIAGCDLCENNDDCLECKTGFCYDEANKACHSNSGVNCDSCTLKNEAVTCLTCPDEYFLNVCQRCSDSNCISCTADRCEMCDDAHYLNVATGSCVACPSGCLSCADGQPCSECTPGTFWDSSTSQCSACLPLCAECNNIDNCNTCSFPNMYKDTASLPNSCEYCISGCASCDDGTTCSSCMSGYRPVNNALKVTTQCEACPTGCANCTLGNDGVLVTCHACAEAYIQTAAGDCVGCSTFSNCMSCADRNKNDAVDTGDCDECVPGYILDDTRSACVECSVIGCDVCEDRYYVCDACVEEQIPTEDLRGCGTQCWSCVNDDACATAPDTNSTTEAYQTVGCINGCWVTRNESSTEVVYARGCKDSEKIDCDAHDKEMCMDYGEGEQQVTECMLCCKDGMCNTQELTGTTNSATRNTCTVQTSYLCTLIATVMLFLQRFVESVL